MVCRTMNSPLLLLLCALALPVSAQNPPAAPASQTSQTDQPRPTPPADLSALLRDALFEEEATRDLTKAAAAYEALLAQWDQQRALAASALYRLAEVRRKQDRTADAIALYQRLLTEFPDADPHARLARENLTALGAKEPAPASAATPALATAMSDEEAKALARIQKLLEESPDLVAGREFTDACGKGWLSVVKFLNSRNITDDGEGLRRAAAAGHLAVVRELLTLKPLPDHLSGALAAAVEFSMFNVASLLLEAGAKPEDPDGRSSLLATAISRERRELTELLLQKKAAVNPEKASVTPLYSAAALGDAALVKRLLDLGAKPDAGGAEPFSLRPTAPPPSPGVAVPPPGGFRRQDGVLDDSPGSTPLHAAVRSGSAECVDLLLAAKANPGIINVHGWTPLHIAAERSDAAITEKLLAAGADPNAGKGQALERSPLVIAAERLKDDPARGTAVIAALLKAKANPDVNPNVPPIYQVSFIHDQKVRDEALSLFLAAGANPEPVLAYGHPSVKVPLLRSLRYPQLAGEPVISLSFPHSGQNTAAKLARTILTRQKPEETPPGLAPLLLEWQAKGGWGDLSGTQPDWSVLRLWRKGADGKLTETPVALKAGADFPALQWGDVLEFVSKDWDTPIPPPDPPGFGQANNDPRFTAQLPDQTAAILRSGQSARITFKSDGFTKDLTLRGALRTYEAAGSEAPLQSFADTVRLLAGDRPGVVKVERSPARGGGVVEWTAGSGNGRALPEEGDVITFTPDKPDAKNLSISLRVAGQPGVWKTYGPAQEISLLQFLSEFYRALPPEWVLSGQAKDPAARAAEAKSLTAEQAVANLIASGRELSAWPALPWPDWSGVKVRRWIKSGEMEPDGPSVDRKVTLRPAYKLGEPESFDLLAAMKTLTAESTADQARKFDTLLNPGDEVEIPLLKDHPAGPWPGLDEAALRLFTKTLTARITVTDLDGRFRETTLQWLPPRWLPTAAGVLPIPDGEASSGRLHVIRAREFAESVIPGSYPFQVVRGGQTLHENDRNQYLFVVLRPGDSVVLAQQQQNTNGVPNIRPPGVAVPQIQPMIPNSPPPGPQNGTPPRRRVTLPAPQ